MLCGIRFPFLIYLTVMSPSNGEMSLQYWFSSWSWGQRVGVKFRPQISKQSFMSSAPTVNASSQGAHVCPTKKVYEVHPTFENCPLDWESNTSTEYNNKSKDTRTKVVLARILEKQGPSSTPDCRTALRNRTAELHCRTALQNCTETVVHEQSTPFLRSQPPFWAINPYFGRLTIAFSNQTQFWL